MPSPESFHSARLMGAWVVDMADLDAARRAIAACQSRLEATLEVRHTLWGVQVRTDSQDAVDLLAGCFAQPAAMAA
jgi:hypothetical protein